MPWKETHVMEERMKLIVAHLGDGWPMSEVCEALGVSRKTGYKWLERYERAGLPGLADRSRAPRQHPNAMAASVAAVLLAARRAHPRWGPRKLVAWVGQRHSGLVLPAPSTVGDLLKREGLVGARRRRRRRAAVPTELTAAAEPNAVWCGDFKGWFRLGNGQRCDPLTLSDACTRYLLRCSAVERTDTPHVQTVFESAFREYGLPAVIRTDNGPPFASTGLGGLSRLAVWWIKLGIRPERIVPGHPEQNGRHERMHRTLAEAVTRPPRASGPAQQRAFNAFRTQYNHERPHEALAQRPPATCYTPSPRPYPRRLPAIDYPLSWEVRTVRWRGEIKWAGALLYLSEALGGERVGLEALSDRHWRISFGPLPLALLDMVTRRVLPYRALTTAPAQN
jgi:transposase InsO family protein